MAKPDVMIIDYDKCVRIARGDESFARPGKPMRCPACHDAPTGETYVDEESGRSHKTTVRYLTKTTVSGKLWQGGPLPKCENHTPPVEMVEV